MSGWLAQPANAVSSLAYVAVGVWVLWVSRRAPGGRALPLSGGLALIGAGIGSVAYHGPQPGWAELAHEGSVACLVLVFVGHAVRRLARMGLAETVMAWRSAAAWMVPALAAYVAGRTGSSLCHPDTLWQAHAAWHGLSAVSLGVAVLGGVQRTSRTPSMPPERWPGREQ